MMNPHSLSLKDSDKATLNTTHFNGQFHNFHTAQADGSFAAGSAADPGQAEEQLPPGAALVTFPRSPKPHDVLEQHRWVRQHWTEDEDTASQTCRT